MSFPPMPRTSRLCMVVAGAGDAAVGVGAGFDDRAAEGDGESQS